MLNISVIFNLRVLRRNLFFQVDIEEWNDGKKIMPRIGNFQHTRLLYSANIHAEESQDREELRDATDCASYLSPLFLSDMTVNLHLSLIHISEPTRPY